MQSPRWRSSRAVRPNAIGASLPTGTAGAHPSSPTEPPPRTQKINDKALLNLRALAPCPGLQPQNTMTTDNPNPESPPAADEAAVHEATPSNAADARLQELEAKHAEVSDAFLR